MDDIDIVVTWVDGSDPDWVAEKAKYDKTSDGQTGDNSEVRYRDWDLLRYWFRGIEKYATWARKIHFVTWGHLPKWLNIDHPKLHVVRHDAFIPEQYLPTFNSHSIEWNIHRIDGLAECFVYFNDDVFLVGDIGSDYFFKKSRPCDQATIGPYTVGFRHSIAPIVANDIEIINTRFNQKSVIRKKPLNWFNPKYGRYNLFNLAGLMWPYFTGFQYSHYANAYTKSAFQTIWDEEYDAVDETCQHKFRSSSDVNHWLVRYWQLVTNNFEPRKQKGASFLFTSDPIEKINSTICSKGTDIFCLNDSNLIDDFEKKKFEIHESFDKVFPEKSQFERS